MLGRLQINTFGAMTYMQRSTKLVSQAFYSGFTVNGRRWYLAASTDNMIKEAACWCVSPPVEVEDPRRFIQGLFSAFTGLMDIPCQAKLVARAGLLFSAPSIGPANFHLQVIEDLTSKETQAVLTDGCGLISTDLFVACARACRQLGFARLAREASVVQIRIFHKRAGIWYFVKGVLRISPDLPMNTVVVRLSMIKIPSMIATVGSLGLCETPIFVKRIMKSDEGRLNLNDMLLREANGVSPEVIVRMARKELGAMFDMDKADMEESFIDDLLRRAQEHSERLGVGFRFLNNPWLVLNLVTHGVHSARTSSLLSNESRREFRERLLHLSFSGKAATLPAVPDDTGTLEPGEVVVKTSIAGCDESGFPSTLQAISGGSQPCCRRVLLSGT